jgi:hypothetical protein
MRFEERELMPYAEPLSVTETVLKEASAYFGLIFADTEMLIPDLETFVFLGWNLEPEDERVAYFQDITSYNQGIRYPWNPIDRVGRFHAEPRNKLNHIFEYDRALDGLLKCSLRRRMLDRVGPLRFEACELSPSIVSVSATELQEGEVYFVLTYADDDRLIPVMDTRVFIGRNLGTKDKGKIYFQEVRSFQEGISYDSTDKESRETFFVESETDLTHIFEFERALEELMRCSLRRREL